MKLLKSCVILILALTMLLAACGNNASTPAAPLGTLVRGDFVGEAGTLGDFGLSTNGQQVIAYLCDGTSIHLSLAEWLKGTVTNKTINITNAHGVHLVATLTAQAVTGTITLKDGRSAPFTAPIIPNPGNELGLYRSEQTFNGVPYLGGWIINPQNPASSSLGVPAFLAGTLIPSINCCIPQGIIRGGIINVRTGALIPSPLHDFSSLSQEVPNLGTFTLRQCRLGTC